MLVVAAALGLVGALAAGGDDPTPTTEVATEEPRNGIDVDPGVVAAALERVEAIDQPVTTWLRLADCESGEWDADATPIPGSAEWDYGADADTMFEGGLHFEPSTWDEFRDPSMAAHAGDAVPLAQLVVAERVLDAQGWQAWPVCSRKLGLR